MRAPVFIGVIHAVEAAHRLQLSLLQHSVEARRSESDQGGNGGRIIARQGIPFGTTSLPAHDDDGCRLDQEDASSHQLPTERTAGQLFQGGFPGRFAMSQLYLQRFEYRAAAKSEFDQAWGIALQTFASTGN